MRVVPATQVLCTKLHELQECDLLSLHEATLDVESSQISANVASLGFELVANEDPAGFIALDWSLMTLALLPILIRISLRTRTRNVTSPSAKIADAFVVLAWLSGCVLISINTWKNHLRMKCT